MLEDAKLLSILEASLLVSTKPLSILDMQTLFDEDPIISIEHLKNLLIQLQDSYKKKALELKEVASGFRLQVRQEYTPWIKKLFEEKPQKYTRALLETLALIAYRQPITRGEIEDIRGVSVSSHIIKTLQDRQWTRIIGHRDLPGRPALFATTKQFLDYFNLSSLKELPSLAKFRDLDVIAQELEEKNRHNTTEISPQQQENIEVNNEKNDKKFFKELDELEAKLPENIDKMIKQTKL